MRAPLPPDGQAGPPAEAALGERGIACLQAPNPGPLTLSGTNTWVLGRDPAWVIDPGPALELHLDRLLAEVRDRGGLGGVALTHDHDDHAEAAEALLGAHDAPLAAGRGPVDVRLEDGVSFGPLLAIATPGHAADHFALIAGDACFSGDAVLGEGSVFISPYPGSMSAYLAALTRLSERPGIAVLCPGHGPPVWDPPAKLEQYLAHRLERERLLIAALAEGKRSLSELLDAVWADVPAPLRAQATATLAAHLDRLEEQGVLPDGVERPLFARMIR